MSESDDYVNGSEMEGAFLGVKSTVALFGLSLDDDLCMQIAVAATLGFILRGGCEARSLDQVRVALCEARAHARH